MALGPPSAAGGRRLWYSLTRTWRYEKDYGRCNKRTDTHAVVAGWFPTFKPGGVARAEIDHWLTEREQRDFIRSNWANLVTDASRLDRGSGEVLVVEFADYQCPFCRQFHDSLKVLLEQYPYVGVAYRHFPLTSIHPAADGAARAAVCAEEQDRFLAMHDYLFESIDLKVDSSWTGAAKAAGVPDLAQFEVCLSDSTTVRRVLADKALGEKLGISGTPSVVVRNAVVTGAVSVKEFVRFLGLQ